jgi:hypothetical protein
VEEVAVNNAGKNPQLSPLRDATGKLSSSAPKRMITAKTMAMIWVELSLIRQPARKTLLFFRCSNTAASFRPILQIATLLILPFIIPTLASIASIFCEFLGSFKHYSPIFEVFMDFSPILWYLFFTAI